jgi:hypothetical protein
MMSTAAYRERQAMAARDTHPRLHVRGRLTHSKYRWLVPHCSVKYLPRASIVIVTAYFPSFVFVSKKRALRRQHRWDGVVP